MKAYEDMLSDDAKKLIESTLDISPYISEDSYNLALVRKHVLTWSRRQQHQIDTINLLKQGQRFKDTLKRLKVDGDVATLTDTTKMCDGAFAKAKRLVAILKLVDVIEKEAPQTKGETASTLLAKYDQPDSGIPKALIDKLSEVALQYGQKEPAKKKRKLTKQSDATPVAE